MQRLKAFLENLDAHWEKPPLWVIDETIAQDTRVAVRGHLEGTRNDRSNAASIYFFGMLQFQDALLLRNSLLYDRAALT